MGNHYTGGIFKTSLVILMALAVLIELPQISAYTLPLVDAPSATYDCDDETLDMYQYYQGLGFKCFPVVGNLDIRGESYAQSNHVWLVVIAGGKLIAYDWGQPCYDKQHYEGYKITYDYLLYAVRQDQRDPSLLGIASDKTARQ
jgi:hypothetical protein